MDALVCQPARAFSFAQRLCVNLGALVLQALRRDEFDGHQEIPELRDVREFGCPFDISLTHILADVGEVRIDHRGVVAVRLTFLVEEPTGLLVSPFRFLGVPFPVQALGVVSAAEVRGNRLSGYCTACADGGT